MHLFGWPGTTQLALHSLVHPPIVLTGAFGVSAEITPHQQPGFSVYVGPRGGLTRFLDGSPEARVQDVTAAAAIQSTTQLHPGLIVDVCAGRGTKTGQLAHAHPESDIVATDIDRERLAFLREQFTGHPRVRIVNRRELSSLVGRADLVLLDVPCSNTGVLARRVEAKYRFDRESLGSLVSVQRQIIADAIPLLGDRGTLLYSTCSLDVAENQEQVHWITRWHRLEATTVWEKLPQGAPGDSPTSYVDGGFFAHLVKAQRRFLMFSKRGVLRPAISVDH